MTAPSNTTPPRLRRDVDEILSQAMDAGPPSWRRRVVRRTTVVALGVLLVVHATGLLIDSAVLFLLSVLLAMPLFAALNLSTRGLFELRPDALDERMRTERLRFHQIGYRISVGLLLAMLVGVGIIAAAEGPARLSFIVVEAGVIAILLAPRVAGAWLLPDEPEAALDRSPDDGGTAVDAAPQRSAWGSLWRAAFCVDLVRADWRSPAGRRTLRMLAVGLVGGGVIGFIASFATNL